MKVFTFYYNRFDTATTSRALAQSGIAHNVLIHSADDLAKFKAGDTLHGNAIVTGNAKGLANQRNSALDMLDEGEWGAFLCDDLKVVRSYPIDWILSKTLTVPVTIANQRDYKLTNAHNITLRQMFTTFPKLIEIAEASGIHLVGFGLTDNPLNLRKKFAHRGLADGRCWLVKKARYKFDLQAQLVDDVAWTAENLVRHRNVLILNWIVPFFQRYSAGGFGSIPERLAQRRKECAYLAQKYDPLVRIAKKPGWEPGTHVRIYGTDGNIVKARQARGML
jgi:hypothetical protein